MYLTLFAIEVCFGWEGREIDVNKDHFFAVIRMEEIVFRNLAENSWNLTENKGDR